MENSVQIQPLGRSCSPEDDMLDGDLGDGIGVRGQRSSRMKRQSYSGVTEALVPGADGRRSSGRTDDTWIPGMKSSESLQRTRWNLQGSGSVLDLSKEELREHLQQATEMIDLLCCELDVAHRYLEGKYKALKILQGKAILDKATSHTQSVLQKSEEKAKALEKEVNSLQWELSFNQVQMKKSQQSWEQSHSRVLSENRSLTKSLEEKESVIQQLRVENSALSRQCLELLSMLTVKEQRTYQETKPQCSLDRDAGILELAVLGACRCVGVAEVCPCSRTAAASRKQLIQLQHELDSQRSRREEALMVADAFRIAFEQQLRKRSEHFMLAAEANILKSHHSKTEGVNRSPLLSVGQRLRGLLPAGLEVKTPDELSETLYRLLDLLNDKEEALAHQRKVSIMLAHNAEELQRQLCLDPPESRIPSKQAQGQAENQSQSDTTESEIKGLSESNNQARVSHNQHKSGKQHLDPSETSITASPRTTNQTLPIHRVQESKSRQTDIPHTRTLIKSPRGSLRNQNQSETPESEISQKTPKTRSPESRIPPTQRRQTKTKSPSNHYSHNSETHQSETPRSRIPFKQQRGQVREQLDRQEFKIQVLSDSDNQAQKEQSESQPQPLQNFDPAKSKFLLMQPEGPLQNQTQSQQTPDTRESKIQNKFSSESNIQAQKHTGQQEPQPQTTPPSWLSDSKTQELSDPTQTIMQLLSNLPNHQSEIQHAEPSDSNIQPQSNNKNNDSKTQKSDTPESRIYSDYPEGPLEDCIQAQQTPDTQESKKQFKFSSEFNIRAQQQLQLLETKVQPGGRSGPPKSRTKLQDLSDLTQSTFQPRPNHKCPEPKI